ncbi:transglycosylase SLT domain-containing protein [Microbacterium sp. NPDC056234]|uniref:aggregation-promoting factor C-terminal-like domain-containing protein n=1 Tax=Microbacterium sp. NPDC056234 TaxID=3345757 RepID=UPI0035E3B204
MSSPHESEEIAVAPASGRADIVFTAKRPAPARARWSRRRGVVATFASLAVVGFAAAIVAPTGFALAETADSAQAQTTVYSLAAEESQDLRVTVDGAAFAPVDRGTYEVYVTPKPTPTPTPKPASSGSKGKGSSGSGSRPQYTGGGSPAEWMSAAGIAEGDWGFVDYIVSKESGWNPNAVNRSSGASGLVQALPCGKVPGNCFDPVDNLRWANGYATGRYGSWEGAYNFWRSNHWW